MAALHMAVFLISKSDVMFFDYRPHQDERVEAVQ
jgi:hypothetical protein